MPETRFTLFPALSVYLLVGISRSASEPMIGSICVDTQEKLYTLSTTHRRHREKKDWTSIEVQFISTPNTRFMRSYIMTKNITICLYFFSSSTHKIIQKAKPTDNKKVFDTKRVPQETESTSATKLFGI